MSAPAFARALIDRRNRGERIEQAFIAVGWPSSWLREFLAQSPFARHAGLLATPEPKAYDYRCIVGLSACIWFEREQDAERASQIAAAALTAKPLRLYTLNAVTGETRFYRVATEWRVAA